MQDFRSKVVVITGGASGIGRALAYAFAEECARLVLADIDEQPLRTTERELRELGTEVLAVRTDVADPVSVQALAEAAMDKFGAVHILCNNAGVGQPLRPVWDFPSEYWKWFFSINVGGIINGVNTFVPLLLNQEFESHVVNTASVAGLLSFPLCGLYCAAKHAVLSLSESLFAELSFLTDRVKVSVLCPGLVRTQLPNFRHAPVEWHALGHFNQELGAMYNSAFECGVEPGEIASKVLDGIRKEQLYIFTHQEFDDAVRDHAEDVILQRNPTMRIAAAGSVLATGDTC